jgi:hypothetical protein
MRPSSVSMFSLEPSCGAKLMTGENYCQADGPVG